MKYLVIAGVACGVYIAYKAAVVLANNRDRIPMSFSAWRHRLADLVLQGPHVIRNVKVWKSTEHALTQGKYETRQKQVFLLDKPNFASLVKIDTVSPSLEWPAAIPGVETEITVANEDCLDATLRLLREGHNPAMLNMANPHHPGGSYTRGASAQEEDIFRRSDASAVLDCPATIRALYPIDQGQSIYIPALQVFRSGSSREYEFFEDGPKRIAMICSAAVRDPKTTQGGTRFAKDSDRDFCRRAIETQLFTALRHGHDAVVLGAWGCGGFGCPPQEISALYEEALRRYGVGRLRRVVFAIVSSYDHQPSRDTNFHVFTDKFHHNV